MKLYSADEMTRADEGAQKLGIPGGVLMERASVEMARATLEHFGPLQGRTVLVVAGGGNNGGDGFVIARELYLAGADVAVFATKSEYEGDPKTNLDVLRNLDVRFIDRDGFGEELDGTDLVVDALLGTGFRGEVREDVAALIQEINDSEAAVVSVDVPSGVDGSTGEVWGAAVRADLTACGHAAKLGCVVSPGREYSGEVVVVEIGIPPEADVEPEASWADAGALKGLVPRRAGASHKYSAGSLLIVAGSGMATGATVMVARGAQRAGCGIIFVVTSESAAQRVDAQITEVLVSGVPEDEDGLMTADAVDHILEQARKASAIVVGPAAGVGEGGRRLVEGILEGTDLPMLLDADAITNLSGTETLAQRSAPTVITPHAGELGRLLGESAKDISARRLHYARGAAEQSGSCVLLKGNATLVTEGAKVAVNSTGTPGLATAGTGDILSGVIGALLSRGMDPYDAARAGAWAHGRAAELWLEESGWPLESMAATDLLPYVPRAMMELV
ncbi:MAG: NAD(P)H-hydrate dehydratase [Actinomycetota bacterium]|nr:NAD(P)H-hydrate dehydratase [Actinomycetota bacterium]